MMLRFALAAKDKTISYQVLLQHKAITTLGTLYEFEGGDGLLPVVITASEPSLKVENGVVHVGVRGICHEHDNKKVRLVHEDHERIIKSVVEAMKRMAQRHRPLVLNENEFWV